MAIYLNGKLVAGGSIVNADGEQLATKDDLKGLDQLNTSSLDENKALIIDGNGKITLSDNTINNMGGGSGNSSNYVTKVMNATEGNIAVLNSDGSLADGEVSIDNIIPHIGENNHWYIGTEDTGVVAKGEDGQSPVVTATKSGKVTTIKVNETPIAEINDGATGPQGPVGPAGAPGISMAQFKALNLVNGKVINEECYLKWWDVGKNTMKSSQNYIRLKNSTEDKYKIVRIETEVMLGDEIKTMIVPLTQITDDRFFLSSNILNQVYNEPEEFVIGLVYEPLRHFLLFFSDSDFYTLSTIPFSLLESYNPFPDASWNDLHFDSVKIYLDPKDFGDFVIYSKEN